MSGGMIPQRGSSLKTSAGIPALTQSLVKDLYALSKEESSCDMMFLVGVREERVMAHKLIVLARCENYKQKKEEWLSATRMIQVKLGKHSKESVKKVIKYLYTGEIEVGTPEVFQVLELCSIFGLSSLESHCVDRIMSQLSTNNVCSVLSMAGNLVQKGSVCFNNVVDRCVMYIELHAKEVVDTEGFLQLSRDCLIQLISSDKLVLSEEDVWRSVIRWGENQAGCAGGYSQWTDDDRLNVKEALSEVIEHVRLLQISSEVFAKEVEPTGLLTMEQTLARYRHAAVPGMIPSNTSSNEQLKPRSSRSFFPDSMLLLGQDQYQSMINEWYGTSSQVWIMLYRGSRDGYSAKQFHEKCDEKGPTLTLVKPMVTCLAATRIHHGLVVIRREDDSNDGGVIAGVVISVLFVIIVVIAVVAYMIYKGYRRNKDDIKIPPPTIIIENSAVLPLPKLDDDDLSEIPTISYEKPPATSEGAKESSSQSKLRKNHKSERVTKQSQEVYKWNRSYSVAQVKNKYPNGSRIPSCYPIGEYVGSLSDNEGDMYDHVTSPSGTGRRRSMSISDLTSVLKDIPNYSLQVPSNFLSNVHAKRDDLRRLNSKPKSGPPAIEMDDDMTDLYDSTLRSGSRDRSNTLPSSESSNVRLSGMAFSLSGQENSDTATKMTKRDSSKSVTSARPVTQYVNSEIVEQHRESVASDAADTTSRVQSPAQERIVKFREVQEEPTYVTMKPAKISLPNLGSYFTQYERPPRTKPLSFHDKPVDKGPSVEPPIELVGLDTQPRRNSIDIDHVVSDSEA